MANIRPLSQIGDGWTHGTPYFGHGYVPLKCGGECRCENWNTTAKTGTNMTCLSQRRSILWGIQRKVFCDLLKQTKACICLLTVLTVSPSRGQRQRRFRINSDGSIIRTTEENVEQIERRFLNQPDDTATWGPWGALTPCQPSCGGSGFNERLRSCSTGNNQDCSADGSRFWEVKQCNTVPCPPEWSEWSYISGCSVTCGPGIRPKQRNCSTGVNSDCPGDFWHVDLCDAGSCSPTTATLKPTTVSSPAWSSWGNYLPCSATCGNGFKQRTRTCSTGSNADCHGQFYDIATCNPGPCVADGVWSDWTSWSSCSASCGLGNETRSRTCTFTANVARGRDCVGAETESYECNSGPCPVDGVWSTWDTWDTCSKSCDTGVRVRTRNCTFPDNSLHGAFCVGIGAESGLCGTDPCPEDGFWASWSVWSNCSQSCGGGTRFRARACAYEPGHPHGKPCEGDNIEQVDCNTQECAVDGTFTSWTAWTQCTATCNGGIQQHQRVCTYSATAPHGKPCVGNTSEIRDCGLNECPVDGVWESWSQWSSCSKTCGSGLSRRNRTCGYPSPTAPHGRDCQGHASEAKACNTNLCPVDGQWSLWGRFFPCTKTCGGGDQVRVRTCRYNPVAPHGKACAGRSVDVKLCNNVSCPVDGTFDTWSSWSVCSKSCARGFQTRTRNCVFPDNTIHGADCFGNRNETQDCNISPCPTSRPTTTTTTQATADGSWSPWGAWSGCSRTCGTGSRERSRQCTWPDKALHGQYCPGDKNQTQDCNIDHCPVDGVWSSWQSWSRCSVTCANGTQTRTRSCNFDPRYPRGDNCTGTSQESQLCHQGNCPVDGQWSVWAAWTSCSVTCGEGTQGRLRTCTFQPNTPHGQDCVGESHQNQTCNNTLCPVDGTLTSWGMWSNCSVSCGTGTRQRDRDCFFPPIVPRGKDCGASLNATESCNTNLCPVDGHWEPWSSWGSCSKTCGKGRQSRTRTCQFDALAPHGADCIGSTSQRQRCNTDPCPVDGHLTNWVNWSLCSQTCGNGTRTRSRTCEFVSTAPRGANCTGETDQIEDCFEGLCPVDGQWAGWNAWSACTVACGNGTSTRNRQCTFPSGGPQGKNCTGAYIETQTCNPDLCPIDGIFSSWGEWSSCSVTCGTGIQARVRICLFDSVAPRGKDCRGNSTDVQNCNTNHCPVKGTWTTWSKWTLCSQSCGGGNQYRTRKCQFLPAGAPHGADCVGPQTGQQACNTNLCAVDGQWSAWSNWSDCSKSCENGTRSRARRCNFSATAPHGKPCVGNEKEAEPCNTDLCPIDGHWSQWSQYSTCSVTCGNGTHTRDRSCIFHDPNPHGSICYGATNETNLCQTRLCPVDGVWTEWGNWTSCSSSCGGGKQFRVRVCDFPDGVPHGKNCSGNANEEQTCNSNKCPVDGVLSQWTTWSDCSYTCGNGTQIRIRTCDFPTGTGVIRGKNCSGDLSETKLCNNGTCPVDGVWAQWAAWSVCNVTCGGGYQIRQRNCSYPAGVPQGDPCPGNATNGRNCNTGLCAVDGVWSSWSGFSACSKSCGNGTSSRSRTCQYLPAGVPQGKACPGLSSESIPCNTTECPQDAVWSVWSNWSTCTASCNNGTQSRDRVCSWPSSIHGNNCSGDKSEAQICNSAPCAADGEWGNWKTWSACSTTCDTGARIRFRECQFNSTLPRGKQCLGTDQESDICIEAACPVDGVWTQWTNWGGCSVTCGSGVISRIRTCSYPNLLAPHGKNCTGSALETNACKSSDCPVDGVWHQWGPWSKCSQSCGGGFQIRRRTCDFPPHVIQGDYCLGRGTNTQPCASTTCPTAK